MSEEEYSKTPWGVGWRDGTEGRPKAPPAKGLEAEREYFAGYNQGEYDAAWVRMFMRKIEKET